MRKKVQKLNPCSRLVDEITYKKAAAAKDVATQSAILGPFFRTDDPVRARGSTISFNTPKEAEVGMSMTEVHYVGTDETVRQCTCTGKFSMPIPKSLYKMFPLMCGKHPQMVCEDELSF